MMHENREKLVTDIMDIGKAMLLCGAEVSRVEDSIARLFSAYGAIRTDVLTILSSIELTVIFPDSAPITRHVRIHSSEYDTDLEKLEEWNALSRKLCSSPYQPDEVRAEINKIKTETAQDKSRNLKKALGYSMASGGFALFFGGAYGEGLLAAAGGLLIWFAEKWLESVFVQKFLKLFLLSVLDGAIGLLAGAIGLDPGPVAAGCVMVLIPGAAFTISIRDTLIGDTISGALKMVESLVSACFVAAGLLAAMLLSGDLYTGSAMTGMAEHSFIQIAAAAVGTLGFAMLFRCSRKRYLICTLSGAFTWGIYLLFEQAGAGIFASFFFAGAAGTLFAEIVARTGKMPSTVTLLPAIITLVPGRSLYLSMENIGRGHDAAAIEFGQATAITAVAIAAGMLLVSTAVNSVNKVRNNRKKRS